MEVAAAGIEVDAASLQGGIAEIALQLQENDMMRLTMDKLKRTARSDARHSLTSG